MVHRTIYGIALSMAWMGLSAQPHCDSCLWAHYSQHIVAGKWAEAKHTGNMLLHAYHSREDSAEVWYRLGLKAYRKRDSVSNTDQKLLLAWCHHCVDQAITLFPPAHPRVADSYRRKAFCYKFDGQFRYAILYFKKAANAYQTQSTSVYKKREASCYRFTGESYNYLGEYEQSVHYLNKAIQLYQRFSMASEDYGASYIILGITFYSWAKHPAALAHFDTALYIARRYDLASVTATAHAWKGQSLHQLKRYREAEKNLRIATRLFSKKDTLKILETILQAATCLADCREVLGLPQEADSLYRAAIAYARDQQIVSRDLGKLHLAYGQFLLRQEKPRIALRHFHHSLSMVLPDAIDTTALHQLPSLDSLQRENIIFRGLAGKGEAYFYLWEKTHDPQMLERAVAVYDRMIAAEQVFRHGQSLASSKLEEARRSHLRHEHAVRAAYTLYKADGSRDPGSLWKMIETSKAVVLAERLWKESQMDSTQILLEPISLKQAQKLLENKQGLIDFFWGEDVAYILLVRQKGTPQVHRIEISPALTASITRFAGYHQRPIHDKKTYARLAHQLYTQLLAPLGELPERLIIVPDGSLYHLPFEALLTQEQPPDAPYTDWHFLLRKSSISYAPSASLLNWLQQTQAEADRNCRWLGIAPVHFEGGLADLAPSPGWLTNLHNKALGQGTLLEGSTATKASFLQALDREKRPFCLLHFYTHAHADGKQAGASWIQFHGSDSARLYLKELYGLKLPVRLAVLAACETGTGQLHKGEGLMSLARGFFHAGCQSVLAASWKVRKDPTDDILTGFYKYLAAGKPKDVALQQAKRDCFEQENWELHPHFWAGLRLVGDTAAIHKANPSWTWIMMGLPLLGLIIWLLSRFYRSHVSHEKFHKKLVPNR